jgi:cell division septal protein FtsQ
MPRKRRLIDPNTMVLIRHVLLGVAMFAGFGLLLAGVWYGSHWPALNISSVTVKGGETISYEEVKNKVEASLDGEYLKIIPRSFILLYPQKEILESIKEIERVDQVVFLREKNELQISLTEHLPSALWCDENIDSCLFLNERGFAYGTAPKLAGGSLLRFVKIGEEPKRGVEPFTVEQLATILTFSKLLETRDFFIGRVDIDAVNDAFVTLSGGGELKLSLNDEPVAIMDNLITILDSEEFSHLQSDNFQYIDLRFGNKVFVNEEFPEESISTSTATSTESE